MDQLLIEQLCDQNKTGKSSIAKKNYLLHPLSQRPARKLDLRRQTSGRVQNKVDLSQNVFINFIENKRVGL